MGDKLSRDKTENCIRLGFCNVRGIPIDPTSDQHQHILEKMGKRQFDIMGLQELNLNFKILGPSGQWKRRFAKFHGITHASFNQHNLSNSKVLHGGTALLSNAALKVRTQKSGDDTSGLGRWSWTLLEGQQGIQTRVISFYRPVPDTSDKACSVFSQHEVHFNNLGLPRNPRQAFLDDLGASITRWITAGEQIICGGDMNEDIQGGTISSWASDLGLIDIYHRAHPRVSNVATCNKSTVSNFPIDGVWVTPGLAVSACGYSGFGSTDIGTQTDHRLLWLDVDTETLFGFRAPVPVSKTIRRFPLDDPGARKRYVNKLKRSRRSSGIITAVGELSAMALAGTDSALLKTRYDELAAQDLKLREDAKQSCKPFYAGQVLFSDVIGLLRKEIQLWWLVYLRRVKRRVDTRKIRRLMHKLGIQDALQLSLADILLRKKDVRARYRAAKKNQTAHFKAFRKKVAERRAAKYKTSVDSQHRAASHTAAMSRHHQNIRRVVDRKPRASINTLTFTTSEGHETACQTREEIESACANEAMRRFSQTVESPFMQGPLNDLLGYEACQATVDAILKGDFVPPEGTDEYTWAFLEEMKMPVPVSSKRPIDGFISPADHIAGWSKMKGKISCSPFGPLFADYIAGSDDIELATIDAAFANLPLQVGFCPTAWTQAVDIMIPKKVSSRHVEKLRIIVLFHSLYNILNKKIGREMIFQADSLGLLPEEAYGSRPGRRANICALNKVLATDILRQLRRAGIICSNDATSCYDRIVHVVASICMQRLGVTPEVCKVMFGTLQSLQHYISTAFGMSDTPYGAIEIPLQGVGQGNGAGPSIWLVMTIPLINMLRSRGFGLHASSAFTHENLFFSCFTFVDDSDTIVSPLNDISTDELVALGQAALDLWGGGLHATGGALALDKTHWWLIAFEWQPRTQKWKYVSPPGQLFLRSPSGAPAEIARLDPSEARESLGVWIAMDGNQSAMVRALTNKIDAWASKIHSRQLSTFEAWLSLTSGISRSLHYPLVATRLSYKECARITKNLRLKALPAIGLPRSLPNAVVYAPQRYLGYNILDWWFEQGFCHLDAVLYYSGLEKDLTGLMLRNEVEALRLEMGLPKSPYSYDFSTWNLCTTPVYLHGVWEFSQALGLRLRDHLDATPLQRIDDQFLMEAFSKEGFSPKQLAILNRCRIHRRVTFLSDISSGDGTALNSGALTDRSPSPNHHLLTWPHSEAPNAHSWRMWHDALRKCFLFPQPDERLILRVPLGNWKNVPAGWPTFIAHDNSALYVRVKGSIVQFLPSHNGRRIRRPHFRWAAVVQTIPDSALPSSATGTGELRWATGALSRLVPDIPPAPSEWWGLPIQAPRDFASLLAGILAGTAIGLTDGSFKEGWGTAAFTLRSALLVVDNDFILVNQTPGDPSSGMDAYRAELGGAFGLLRLVNVMTASLSAASLASASIALACDCESVLKNLFRLAPPRPHHAHYDLLTAARHELSVSRVRWTPQDVTGHMDDYVPYHLLPPLERLNCDMDRLAKSFWSAQNAIGFHCHSLAPISTQWSIWKDDTIRLPSWSRTTAEDHYYGAPATRYWQGKLLVDASSLDWPAIGNAFKRLISRRQAWVPKWLCSRVAIGSNMKRWKLAPTDLCPRCTRVEESRFHVIRCQNPAAVTTFRTVVHNIELWMTKRETHPTLRDAVISMLEAWYEARPWFLPFEADPDVRAALVSQHQLGPNALIDGMLHHSWTIVQSNYYLSRGRRRTGFRWHSQLIRRIWEIAWTLWDHRESVRRSPESLSLARQHDEADAEISEMFTRATSDFPVTASRWFSRTPEALFSEPLDQKRLWLAAIRSFLPAIRT